jgi:glycerol-3-phosphate acyltransferase PlsX
MGGDHAPESAVEGGLMFARAYPFHVLHMVGDEARVRPLVGSSMPSNVELRHASEVVGMDEHAGAAMRSKKDSSLRVCFDLVKAGVAQAVVSAGHSGAVMAGALLVLGRVKGVERPAIATLLPALRGGGRCLLLDAGANVVCKPSHLAQFAVLGEAYVRRVLGVSEPKVALLSNGEEDSKGTDLTREALALLRKSPLKFLGYVEGKDLFSGDVDVVVTDGFTGNVVLKTSEGAALGMTALLRKAIDASHLPGRLGALLLKPTFLGLKKAVDYAEYGGAPLLGVDGVGIVAHGRSSPKAIFNALKAAVTVAEAELPKEILASMHQARTWLPSRKGRGESEHSIPEGPELSS